MKTKPTPCGRQPVTCPSNPLINFIHNLMKNYNPLSMLKRFMPHFCMLAAMLVWAAEVSAQPITLTMRDMTVLQAIEKLQKEYGYSFSISTSEVDVNKKISVSVKDADIRNVLEIIFAGEKVTFTVEGKLISVTKNVGKESVPGEPAAIGGKVLDEQGQPVVGAAVIVKGTTIGVSTDSKGEFSLQIPPPD